MEKTGMFEVIRDELKKHGIAFDAQCCGGVDADRVKVVCVNTDLSRSVAEIGQATRDQVVMVRVDEETIKALDAWVQTGAAKSRSEAAALFIREGLKVRSSELESLTDVLQEVEEAKKHLREKAKGILERP